MVYFFRVVNAISTNSRLGSGQEEKLGVVGNGNQSASQVMFKSAGEHARSWEGESGRVDMKQSNRACDGDK